MPSEMTEQEKIRKLATEIMGWRDTIPESSFWVTLDGYRKKNNWDPFSAVKDAMELQNKALETPRMARRYLLILYDEYVAGRAIWGNEIMVRFFLALTPAQRCEAALRVLEK